MKKDKHPNEALRYHRLLRGWSQQKVADEIGAINEMISRWERGQKKTSTFYQEKLCELFGKNAEELGFLSPTVEDPSRKTSAQKTGEVQTEPTTTVWSETSHDLFNKETEQKAVLSPEIEPLLLNRQLQGVPFVPSALSSTDELLDRFIQAMKKPSTINETTLRYIEARTDGYWKDHYDATFAASDLLSDVAGHFQKVTVLLEASLFPTVRTRLCASASRIAQLAGTLFFDMGNYTYSKKYRQTAILAAREAKDQELEAVAWGRLSMTCMYDNQLQEALISIQEARRLATQRPSFKVYAWLAAVEAEIQAKLGKRAPSLEALYAAECVDKNMQQSDQDSHWLHFDRPSLIGYQGACYRQLYCPHDPQTRSFLEDARKALITTLSLSTLRQRRPTTLVDLADTYVQQGEVEEACKLASQAATMTAELQSGRNLQCLLALRRNLESWKDTQYVQDLDKQLGPLDEQLAPFFSRRE